jgi:pyruvate dehydrogenase E2 component (dihydrolipoamide acetyltransferase)
VSGEVLFRLPSLGADMEAATILAWHVGPGDTVHRGDVVALLDTEKSEIDLEIWDGGTVEELLVDEGVEVPVGTPLARIRTDAAAPSAPTEIAPAPVAPPAPSPVPAGGHEPPVRSPLVRHLAEERHVDLHQVQGSGPGGRITRHDVEAAAPAPPPGAAPAAVAPPAPVAAPRSAPGRPPASPRARALAADRGVPLADIAGSGPGGAIVARDVPAAPPPRVREDPQVAMRRAIAGLMARSKREIPHYYLTQDVDLGAATDWLAAANEARPVTERLLPAALLLRATALAVAAHPELNGFWQDDGFVPGAGVHLGVAVSLRGGGLVAPAILDADQRSLGDLMGALRDLVTRARAGRLRSSEMQAPTITVTSLGDRGVDAVQGVIYPPQVAIVGFGRIRERPWVAEGALAVRPVVTATLAGDHRATDGQTGSRLLLEIDRLLQDPAALDLAALDLPQHPPEEA